MEGWWWLHCIVNRCLMGEHCMRDMLTCKVCLNWLQIPFRRMPTLCPSWRCVFPSILASSWWILPGIRLAQNLPDCSPLACRMAASVCGRWMAQLCLLWPRSPRGLTLLAVSELTSPLLSLSPSWTASCVLDGYWWKYPMHVVKSCSHGRSWPSREQIGSKCVLNS